MSHLRPFRMHHGGLHVHLECLYISACDRILRPASQRSGPKPRDHESGGGQEGCAGAWDELAGDSALSAHSSADTGSAEPETVTHLCGQSAQQIDDLVDQLARVCSGYLEARSEQR